MLLLFWISVCCLLTAASAIPLKYLLLLAFIVNHFVEGRGGVKSIMVVDSWRTVVERWIKHGEAWSMGVDKVRDIENWFRFIR